MITNFNQNNFEPPYAIAVVNDTEQIKVVKFFNSVCYFGHNSNSNGDYQPDFGVIVKSRITMDSVWDIFMRTLFNPTTIGFIAVECRRGDFKTALFTAGNIRAHYSDANGDYGGTIVHLLPDPYQQYENIKTAFCNLRLSGQVSLTIDVEPGTELWINLYPVKGYMKHLSQLPDPEPFPSIIGGPAFSERKRLPWWKRILYWMAGAMQ